MKNALLTLLGILMLALGFACTSKTDTPPPVPAVYSISGTTNLPGTAIAVEKKTDTGTFVSVTGTTTGPTGAFVVSNLQPGTYRLTPMYDKYTFSPASRIAVVENASVTGMDFVGTPVSAKTYSVSGHVSGAPGAIITWSTGTDFVIVDVNGDYVIPRLQNGTYIVYVTLSGYIFVPANKIITVNGADITGVNFSGSATPPSAFSISGTVSGAVVAGVKMTLEPTGRTTTTAADGTYRFSNVYNGNYVVTPSYNGQTFFPVSTLVSVINKDESGINFSTTAPPPQLSTGKLLYAGVQGSIYAIWENDLATGYKNALATSPSTMESIVPLRSGVKCAYRDASGVWILTLPHLGQLLAMPVGYTEAPGYPSTTIGSFDMSPRGDFAAVTLQSTTGKKDIFLIQTNTTMFWVQVTNDGLNSSPVIAAVDVSNTIVTVLFIKNGTEIWKQTMDVNTSAPTGPATLFASNVKDSARPMSINADYTKLAFTKNVGGVSHITVVSLTGGVEVDLGAGSDPYWDLSGSGKILYHATDGTLWVINADGTGKIQVPTPSNPAALSAGSVVFGPAGL